MYFFHNWTNKLFSEENSVQDNTETWQDPHNVDKVKQYEILMFLKMFCI